MKKIFLTLLILFYTLTVVCQETTLIEKKANGQISEKYNVLKSDGKTKHGKYISYYIKSEKENQELAKDKYYEYKVKEEGYYNFGKKDSLWTKYDNRLQNEWGKATDSTGAIVYAIGEIIQGKYKDDKKVGIWIKNKRGIAERFDYDNNKKLPPLIYSLDVKDVYPESNDEVGLSGTVTVMFHINKDCSIDNISIVKGLTKNCDNAVVNAVKNLEAVLKEDSQECEDKTVTMSANFILH